MHKPLSEFNLSVIDSISKRKRVYRSILGMKPGFGFLFSNIDHDDLIPYVQVYTAQFNKETGQKLKTQKTDDGILVFNPA